jgi:hypothetical protein
LFCPLALTLAHVAEKIVKGAVSVIEAKIISVSYISFEADATIIAVVELKRIILISLEPEPVVVNLNVIYRKLSFILSLVVVPINLAFLS